MIKCHGSVALNSAIIFRSGVGMNKAEYKMYPQLEIYKEGMNEGKPGTGLQCWLHNSIDKIHIFLFTVLYISIAIFFTFLLIYGHISSTSFHNHLGY